EEALAFWRDEYRLNAMIKRYRKPYVALIDGVVMGGGVGISVHGSHPVAGDAFAFAMPEVGIGFFPDVGASWFLPRLPGELGTYCALTGAELDAAQACACGIATHRVSSERFPQLIEALCGNVSVDAQLSAFAENVDKTEPAGHWDVLDPLFKAERVEDILASLDAQAEAGGPSAALCGSVAATIRTKSPTSLKVTLALLRRSGKVNFEECMRMEFRLACRVAKGHDFFEGIRSVIIDKDRTPQWRPATLQDLRQAEVKQHFAPIEVELDLP